MYRHKSNAKLGAVLNLAITRIKYMRFKPI